MKLRISTDLALPLDAITQTFCIFGKRGSGKTNGATVLVEELLKAELPVVVLDPVDAWWGLKVGAAPLLHRQHQARYRRPMDDIARGAFDGLDEECECRCHDELRQLEEDVYGLSDDD